jgi:adenylate cyclase
LIAARAMSASLQDLNANLKEDLDEAIRIGIGIHAGPVIVGEMGYAAVRSVTAVGDAVNTASRLETANKDFKSQLVVSAEVVERAAVDLSQFPLQEISIRGRDEQVAVHVLDDATKLPEIAAAKAA